MDDGSWETYRRLITESISDLKAEVRKCGEKLDKVDKDIEVIKSQSKFVGGIFGFLGALVIQFASFFISKK